ncbi:MAG: hypothetical protein PHW17_06645, partial [Desulfobacterales bacterium]|nr:hypothetical protein [Desulfobacterales bacterium]
ESGNLCIDTIDSAVIDQLSGEFNCRPFGALDTTTTSIFGRSSKNSPGNFSLFKGFSGVTCGSSRYRPVLYNFKPIITAFFKHPE